MPPSGDPTRYDRIAAAIDRHGLDVLLALTPENAEYLSRRHNYIASHWRVPGLFSAAVGRDGRLAVVSGDFGVDPTAPPPYPVFAYRIWTEAVDVRAAPGATIAERILAVRPERLLRPAQYDLDEVYDRVRQAVEAVAGNPKTIGGDLREVAAEARDAVAQRFPGATLTDASAIFDELRAVKDTEEIVYSRLAAELTEAGIAGAVARLKPGMTESAVNAAYQIAVHECVMADARFAAFRQAEGVANVGFGADASKIVGSGQTIKFDMQVDVGGYHSDIGRTFAIEPTAEQRAVYAALRATLAAAETRVRPGVTFADVFWTGTNAMRSAGFDNYSRGHLGHSVGLAHYFEEPPFVAPDEAAPLRPGMIVSLELPYYLYGVGAFQLERILLVTNDGHEALDRLPFELELAP
ncbi:MAG TPA: Xaa-Pro peptidase family protein [Thermomicrobiales bacterium]|nr:Xaa-Pro peptidase family protein [Thermomicrobiales bacterium]